MSPGAGATSPNNSKALLESYLDALDTSEQDTDANGAITVNGSREESDAGVIFFMDEEGRYYFQQSGGNQDIDLLNCEEYQDNTEATQQGQVLIGGEGCQTVTLAPSVGGAESCYIVVMQEGMMNVNIKTDQDEEEKEAAPEKVSDKESIGNFLKSASVVKPTKRVERKLFVCSYCPYTSHRRYLLMRHLKTHSVDRPHKCTVCERGFKTVATLQNHVNMHNGIKPFLCEYCKKPFTTSGELVRHVRYRHTHEKPHKCKECGYASVELSKLRRHIRCHTGERPYQCPHCTYASADTFKLKRHIRTHTGEKPYVCDVCNMSFTQSNSRNVHKLMHNVSDKPTFQCELCPTKCGRITDLRIHVQNMHSTDTPLKCKKCSKSFPDRYSHKIHAKTHKGEKCYKCEVCPYASTALCHLNSHMFTHTNEKPFGCDECDQSFRQKQLLRRHQDLYHNPNYVPKPAKKKTHTCHRCKRTYAHKGNLIRHLATHDSDYDSGHNKRASALKLGRKKKINFVDGSADSENEPKQILKLDLEDTKREGSNLVMVESSDMQQYVVVEVIQVDNVEDVGEYVEDDNNNEIHLHSMKGIDQTVKFERDLDTCFGFDEEEIDETRRE